MPIGIDDAAMLHLAHREYRKSLREFPDGIASRPGLPVATPHNIVYMNTLHVRKPRAGADVLITIQMIAGVIGAEVKGDPMPRFLVRIELGRTVVCLMVFRPQRGAGDIVGKVVACGARSQQDARNAIHALCGRIAQPDLPLAVYPGVETTYNIVCACDTMTRVSRRTLCERYGASVFSQDARKQFCAAHFKSRRDGCAHVFEGGRVVVFGANSAERVACVIEDLCAAIAAVYPDATHCMRLADDGVTRVPPSAEDLQRAVGGHVVRVLEEAPGAASSSSSSSPADVVEEVIAERQLVRTEVRGAVRTAVRAAGGGEIDESDSDVEEIAGMCVETA